MTERPLSDQPDRPPAIQGPVPPVALVVALYLAGGLIILVEVGPWAAIRDGAVNGLLVAAWLLAAHWLLRHEPLPSLPLRRPRLELLYSLLLLALTLLLVANAYTAFLPLPPRAFVWVIYAGVLLLLGLTRYPAEAWGLSWPSGRGWAALLAVILLNVTAGVLRALLPPSESQALVGVDMAEGLTSAAAVLLALLSILVGAALPEELLLRVTLQPRLARFVGISWAIFLQALLFSLGHLPQKLFANELPPLLALAYTLLLDNGIIAGYFWYRQRSLPLLLLLHLFAFPRFG
jgi:membrane protease YdiL (CAAX protease family)